MSITIFKRTGKLELGSLVRNSREISRDFRVKSKIFYYAGGMIHEQHSAKLVNPIRATLYRVRSHSMRKGRSMVGAVGAQVSPPPRIPEIDQEHNCRQRLKAVQPTRNLVLNDGCSRGSFVYSLRQRGRWGEDGKTGS